MVDIRELRLALESKLRDRQRLLTENAHLRHEVRSGHERVAFLETALLSPLVNASMERGADEIVNMILERAIKASEAIAMQTLNSGDYEIGIDVPSFHIRYRIARLPMSRREVLSKMHTTKTVNVSLRSDN